MGFNIDRYKLFENLQKARAFLREVGEKETNPNFIKLKTLLSDNPGYLGKFTEWLFKDDRTFNELKNLYDSLKSTKINKDINSFNDTEELYDYIRDNSKDTDLNQFWQAVPSRTRQNIKDENYIDEFEDAVMSDSTKKKAIMDFLSKKSGSYEDDIPELIEKITEINESNILDKETLVAEIIKASHGDTNKEQANSDTKLVYDKDNVVIAEISTHDASVEFGSHNWCISEKDDDSYFKDYTEDAIQYFIWDYNVDTNSKRFLIGVTIGNKKVGHYKDDSSISNEVLNEIISKYNLKGPPPSFILKKIYNGESSLDNYDVYKFIIKNYSKFDKSEKEECTKVIGNIIIADEHIYSVETLIADFGILRFIEMIRHVQKECSDFTEILRSLTDLNDDDLALLFRSLKIDITDFDFDYDLANDSYIRLASQGLISLTKNDILNILGNNINIDEKYLSFVCNSEFFKDKEVIDELRNYDYSDSILALIGSRIGVYPADIFGQNISSYNDENVYFSEYDAGRIKELKLDDYERMNLKQLQKYLTVEYLDKNFDDLQTYSSIPGDVGRLIDSDEKFKSFIPRYVSHQLENNTVKMKSLISKYGKEEIKRAIDLMIDDSKDSDINGIKQSAVAKVIKKNGRR